MGNNFRPLPTKCVEKLLTHLGFKYNRTVGSHDQWTKNGFRTIPVWGAKKEIPAQHIKSNCKILGWEIARVYEWADKHC